MKIGCAADMVPGESITKKAMKMRDWGFEGISLFIKTEDLTDDVFEEIKNLETNTGITPCEIVLMSSLYGNLMHDDETVRFETQKLYERSIDIAGLLGAVTEMEFEYKSQESLPLFEPYREMPSSLKTPFMNLIKKLVKRAERCGATLLIEPCNRYETRYITRLIDAASILKEISSNSAGILADFFHMSIEEADIPKSIIESGSFIKHVHLGDSNRLLPGLGHTDFISAFRALTKIEFQGYMCLECGILGDPEVELPKCINYLKDCIAKA